MGPAMTQNLAQTNEDLRSKEAQKSSLPRPHFQDTANNFVARRGLNPSSGGLLRGKLPTNQLQRRQSSKKLPQGSKGSFKTQRKNNERGERFSKAPGTSKSPKRSNSLPETKPPEIPEERPKKNNRLLVVPSKFPVIVKGVIAANRFQKQVHPSTTLKVNKAVEQAVNQEVKANLSQNKPVEIPPFNSRGKPSSNAVDLAVLAIAHIKPLTEQVKEEGKLALALIPKANMLVNNPKPIKLTQQQAQQEQQAQHDIYMRHPHLAGIRAEYAAKNVGRKNIKQIIYSAEQKQILLRKIKQAENAASKDNSIFSKVLGGLGFYPTQTNYKRKLDKLYAKINELDNTIAINKEALEVKRGQAQTDANTKNIKAQEEEIARTAHYRDLLVEYFTGETTGNIADPAYDGRNNLALSIVPKKPVQKQTNSKSRTPHEILGLSPNATLKEIQQAYKKLALELHPNTVARRPLMQGASPVNLERAKAEATNKFDEIRKAYQELKSSNSTQNLS